MKVPLNITGRTQRTNMPIAEASSQGITPQAFGAGIGQAIEGLGLNVQKVETTLKAKNDQTAKFQAMQSLTAFETQVAQNLQELKRNADPTGAGFLRQADEAYSREEKAFLESSVPPELREEFKARTAEVRQRVVADSLNFEYAVGDAHYKQGISDTLNKAQTEVANDPTSTDKWRQRIIETVDATDLPDIEKENIKRQANISLLKAEYNTGIRDAQINAQSTPGGVAGSFVNKIIGAESGGNTNAKNPNSSAEGLGQFIDSTWVQMMRKYHPEIGGSNDDLIAMKRDPVLGREMTQRYAEENQAKLQAAGIVPTEGGLYLMHFLGPGATKVLSADPSTPVNQVVSSSAIAANGAVFKNIQTVGDLIAWSDKKMGSAPGATAAVTSIMTNPRYEDIPYEDKILIQNDALQQAKASMLAQQQAAKAQQEAQFNTLLNGLNDGVVGAAAIDAARQAGWLTDYDQINKAQDVYKQRNETVNLAGQGYAKMGMGGIFDPTDDKDKKMLNAMVGADGLKALGTGDGAYFTNQVLPIVTKAQDIPTDVMGTLTGMARSNNQSQALFALDALAQLRETSPKAFDARTDSKLASDVDFYNARKDLYPADQLMQLINPNVSQAERQVQASLREEAKQLLMNKTDKIPDGRTMALEVAGDLGTLSAKPGAINVLEAEFSTLFTDAYARYGTVEGATKAATEQLKRTWAPTSVGNGVLMKFPPEKVGYQPIMGTFDWINDEIRKETGQKNNRFELYSDSQTEAEFNAWKGNPSAPPASYRLITFDDNGVPREARLPDGSIRRMNFIAPAEAKAKEAVIYDYAAERRAQLSIITDYANARHQAAMTGQDLPPEMEQSYEAAKKRLEELDSPANDPNVTPEAVEEATRVMGAGLGVF